MADACKAIAPPGKLHVSRVRWSSRRVLHRIHHEDYPDEVFNPGIRGNARFSPIKDAAGALISTLYAGDSFECAAMETVFHDVPYVAGFKSYDKAKLTGQTFSQRHASRDLLLVDLGSKALQALTTPTPVARAAAYSGRSNKLGSSRKRVAHATVSLPQKT